MSSGGWNLGKEAESLEKNSYLPSLTQSPLRAAGMKIIAKFIECLLGSEHFIGVKSFQPHHGSLTWA